jgi:hypothetical protein
VPDPVPDPFDDADRLEDLGEEIATLAAHIHAATHRLLVLLADFDRREGWKLGGHRSAAHWLHARTGIDLGTAREKVRTARVLVGLPETGASMARGELSFSRVRALTRVATPENEGELLDFARQATTAEVERMIRGYRSCRDGKEEVELEEERHAQRTFSVVADLDGMYVVRGRLTPEVGVLLMRAVEAAGDALYRRDRAGQAGRRKGGKNGKEGGGDFWDRLPGPGPEERAREAARRRADALGLLAERALAAGFGGLEEEGEEPEEREKEEGGVEAREGRGSEEERPREEREGQGNGVEAREGEPRDGTAGEKGEPGSPGARDPGAEKASHGEGCRGRVGTVPVPISGSRGERYQVVLHVEAETLEARGEGGRSELDDGTRVSGETSRRLSCDCGVVEVAHGADGSVLDVGRRRRTTPPALRRALEARDRGCRFPGCGLRFTEAHHLVHWANGGETKLSNTLLLCRHHHRLVHEGGWKVDWWGEGRPVFFDPRGGVHYDGRWRPPEVGEAAAEALVEENRRRGVRPDGWTAGARWEREADIPTDKLLRATEILGEALL